METAMIHAEGLKAAREHDPKRPGKFEGEDPATVYYWTVGLDGGGDETIIYSDETVYDVFKVSPEEAEAFGINLSAGYIYYYIGTDSQGFVHGSDLTESELEEARREAEASETEE